MKEVHPDSVGRSHFIGRTCRFRADVAPHVHVTLSVDLLKHLRTEARATQVPLRWLVAGIVCDTMKPDVERPTSPVGRIC